MAAFLVLFLAAGWAYGHVAGTVKSQDDIVSMMSESMKALGYYLVLAFAAAHFAAEARRADAAAGSTGSRLLTGASREHDAFEAFAAQFHEREGALLHPHGRC